MPTEDSSTMSAASILARIYRKRILTVDSQPFRDWYRPARVTPPTLSDCTADYADHWVREQEYVVVVVHKRDHTTLLEQLPNEIAAVMVEGAENMTTINAGDKCWFKQNVL
jgi:hypothetical protein